MSAAFGTPTDEWNQHWASYARSNALNPAQAYRRMLIFRELGLERAPAPVRLLELGSGQGELSAELTQRFPELELVGVDVSQTALALARSRVPKARFFQQDLQQPLTLPEGLRGWASHAVCSEVLEHLDDPLAALQNVQACLAPGARLVVTVPAGPMSSFDRHIGHRAHFTSARLRGLLTDAGFHVPVLHGAGFPFFNLYRLLVVTRGRRLIHEAHALPVSARLAMQVFSRLFAYNRHETSRGWQLVAVATAPEAK